MQAADGGMVLSAPAQQRSHRRVLTVSAIAAGLLCLAAVCSFGQQVCAVCGSLQSVRFCRQVCTDECPLFVLPAGLLLFTEITKYRYISLMYTQFEIKYKTD